MTMESKACHRCGARTLVGLSNGGRSAAVDVMLDPEPLTPIGELDALHGGRRTWTMHHTGDVFARSASIITRKVAGCVGRQSVHADHQCPAREGS
jgi:hypothetical protein